MASTYGFTDATKVKQRLKNYNPDATDAQIETFINHAEGLIIAVTATEWKATIPLLIESLATDLAAMYLLANDPSGFSSITEAAFISDALLSSSQKSSSCSIWWNCPHRYIVSSSSSSRTDDIQNRSTEVLHL